MDWCKWGFHTWVMNCKTETRIHPKEGPFDPRPDVLRTTYHKLDVCAKCGAERDTKLWG